MPSDSPARATGSRRRQLFVLVALSGAGAVASIAVLLAAPSLASTAGGPTGSPSAVQTAPVAPPVLEPVADEAWGISAADGGVGGGASVVDDLPAVTRLDPALLDAVRRAASDAEQDGVVFRINSGWRSAQYQEMLLADAVAEYGSRQEAARWVATPETSPHVRGRAVDLGTDAAAWLSARGTRYGLCQIYANESWHYELRADAVGAGCPEMYPDPTYDPRMQSAG